MYGGIFLDEMVSRGERHLNENPLQILKFVELIEGNLCPESTQLFIIYGRTLKQFLNIYDAPGWLENFGVRNI
jgi:hypothetical protein